MSDLSDRVRQALRFPAPASTTRVDTYMMGAADERARTSALDAALCDAVEALAELEHTELGEPFTADDRLRVNEALTRIELALEGK